MKKEVKKRKSSLFWHYVICLVSLVFFIYLAIDVRYNLFFARADIKINAAFSVLQIPFLIKISTSITNLFEPLTFVLMSFLIVLYLFFKARTRESFLFLATTSCAFIIGNLIKVILHRARPENILVVEKTFSFPSTHALMAVIFFGMFIYLLEIHIKSNFKKILLTVLATLAALIMGLTRIILNAHWFTDVIAGFSLGVFLICAFLIFIKKQHLLKAN